ncbi:MAG: insulinase family protein [Ignavibacteria bacterium]|nr:insulinase family protein [Ignavibacteria bacterium]
MRLFYQLFAFAVLIPLLIHAQTKDEYQIGEVYSGFKLLQRKFVKEVNADCYYFEHVKSGARLFKIANNDPNKTFSIGFKTDPESDCGTPHIMEHSVLNGSAKYPVKSPFDILSKGSLNTYMNAFTGNDFTCFPFASINDKDYFNLMGIYLDAVLHPLFKTDDRVLKQEGWHHELNSPGEEITYKGVVFNEMKGAFSDPQRELSYILYKNLFPDNGYKWCSGGYPTSIPGLTKEMFAKFHQKYYHPVNGHIFLYGNGDLKQELAFIDKEYLSEFGKAKRPEIFPLQKPLGEVKNLHTYYPVTEGSDVKGQTYLSYAVVAGKNADRATTMALNILCDLLVNQEAAPIRLALQEAGIGQDVSASVDELQQNVFSITVTNANPEDMPKFKEIVTATIKNIIARGFDKKALEGAINKVEFSLREGNDAQKGINYNFQVLPGWFFADDPFLTLEYEKPLQKVKSSLTSNYMETILKTEILQNTHAAYLVLEPKAGLEKEIAARTSAKLTNYKNSLSQDQINKLVAETKELIEYQKREDTPEALATMPLLTRSDINPKATFYAVENKTIAAAPAVFHKEFTNNVVYARLLFDLRAIDEKYLPYASLLSNVLGSQNTKNYTYGDLDKEISIHTGGISALVNCYYGKLDDNQLLPKFIVDGRAMNVKTDKLADLMYEIISQTNFRDTARLKDILIRLQARLEGQLKQDGFSPALTRASSYVSHSGVFNEKTSGIEYYRFISELTANFDSRRAEIAAILENIAQSLFSRGNMMISINCAEGDYMKIEKSLGASLSKLPELKPALQNWKLEYSVKNEGFLTGSKVQYVIRIGKLQNPSAEWSGKMKVLEQVLSTDYLQTQLRVIGGAYGGFSGFFPTGNIYFASYRDPNLSETVTNYNGIPKYLESLHIDDKDMTRYIIGTIADVDRPLTPMQKGNTALRYYLEGTTEADLQKNRDQILSTTESDVKGYVNIIKNILDQNALCVYGNEEKIKANSSLFKAVEPLKK